MTFSYIHPEEQEGEYSFLPGEAGSLIDWSVSCLGVLAALADRQ